MTRYWNLALVCGLVTLLSSTNQLVAQDRSTSQTDASATNAESGMGMMGQMDPAMKMKCMMMMMMMKVKPTDPAALLAAKDTLGLSEQQTKMLEQIQQSSQELADELLEPEQREKLDGLAALPDTSMAMHKKMMAMMTKRMKDKMSSSPGKGGMMMGKKGGMMCPMMQTMKEMKVNSLDSGSDKMSDMKEKMKSRMKEKMKEKHSGHH